MQLKLGDRVTCSNPYYVRAIDKGRVTEIRGSVVIVTWDSDTEKRMYEPFELAQIQVKC